MPFENNLPELPEGLLEEFPNIWIEDYGYTDDSSPNVFLYAFSSDATFSYVDLNAVSINSQSYIEYYLDPETGEWILENRIEDGFSTIYGFYTHIHLLTFDIVPSNEIIGLNYINSMEIDTDTNVVYSYDTYFPELPESFTSTYPYVVILWDNNNQRYELLGCKYAWTYDNTDTNNIKLNHTGATNSTCSHRWYCYQSVNWDNVNIGNYYVELNNKSIVYTNHDIKYKSDSSNIYKRMDTNGLYPFKYYIDQDYCPVQKDELVVFIGSFREEVNSLSDYFNISYTSNIFGNNTANQYITIGYRKIEEDMYLEDYIPNNLQSLWYSTILIFDNYEAIKTLESSIITSAYSSTRNINVPNKANDGIVVWVGANTFSTEGKDLTTSPNDLLRVGRTPYFSPRLFAYVDMGDGAIERTFNFTSYGSGAGIILVPIVLIKNLEYTEYATWFSAMANEIRRLTNTSDSLTTEEMLNALQAL
jgi:hypothetical protein